MNPKTAALAELYQEQEDALIAQEREQGIRNRIALAQRRGVKHVIKHPDWQDAKPRRDAVKEMEAMCN